MTAWRKANPQKVAAHAQVRVAIKSGALVRLPCEVCGVPEVSAHHDDYDKPLAVNWLCRLHHRRRHYGSPSY